MIEARGAPVDQGLAQGSALREGIRASLAGLRRRYGFLTWREALREARRGPGRELQRFLPQQHERLEGIAAGAGTSLAALELFETSSLVTGIGSAKGGVGEARLEISPELSALLVLRHSAPDAEGFESVELTCAPWAGCIAGVNSSGIGALVLDDRDPGAIPVGALAQDFLFRAEDLSAATDHLRLRARYAGGSGTLLLVDAKGKAVCVELSRGELQIRDCAGPGALVAESTVRIDAAVRELIWRDASGNERRAKTS